MPTSPSGPALTISALQKSYVGERSTATRVVHGLDLEVQEGEFFTLLGPSGCGKTTTLRCVAGLERPDSGKIVIAGRAVVDDRLFVPPHRRGIGMVFQSYAIWPHLTVLQNVMFPLQVHRPRPTRGDMRRRVQEALAAVSLDGLEDRMATQLSGGQQQRLALARALVHRPRLLLLDEPLSNLDAKLRERLRLQVRSLQRELGVTALYVTHDQSEALSMSSRIAVLNEGRIVQLGTPRDIYRTPATPFVADFVGNTNFVEGRVVAAGLVATALGPQPLSAELGPESAVGDRVSVSIRRENIQVRLGAPPDGEVDNSFDGTVAECVFNGDSLDVFVDVGELRLGARSHPAERLAVGDAVRVVVPAQECVVLGDTGVPGSS